MNAKDLIGAALGIVAMSLAAGGVYAVRSLGRSGVDAADFCPRTGPTGATIILIDGTDPLTANERERVSVHVRQERDALDAGAKIAIGVLRRQAASGAVSFARIAALCNPGSKANPLFQNPKRALARYRDGFQARLDEVMRALPVQGSSPRSPIAKAIDSALADSSVARLSHGRLVLVSDLMEFSDAASAYDGRFGERALASAISATAKAWLARADIEILLLPRPSIAARQEAAEAVWLSFFTALSGRRPVLKHL